MVRLIDPIDSRRDEVGQVFRASLDQPLAMNTAIVASRGSDAAIRHALSAESDSEEARIGFANLSKHIAPAVEIQNALEAACAMRGVELLAWDNDRDAERATENAEAMAASHIDVAIEFQLHEQAAPIVAGISSRAGIPLISIVSPHHGTIYFGVNNYRAGFTAGKALAEFAAQRGSLSAFCHFSPFPGNEALPAASCGIPVLSSVS